MKWVQKQVTLAPRKRGAHLVTRDIISEAKEISTLKHGIFNIFLQHTSASLAINENADPDVRKDLESYLNHLAREKEPFFTHTLEGPDDMPAHIKAIIIGSSLTIPIQNGRLGLGTWQGIYLVEHRNHGGPRTCLITAFGEES